MERVRTVVLERPISDAISKVRFAPRSNHLLISSWDSVLRLYDSDAAAVRMEVPSEGALLDCCFEDESAAFSASSDFCVRRHDLCSGSQHVVLKHDDVATCLEYSTETGQLISGGLDKKVIFWDLRESKETAGFLVKADSEVESLSLCGLYLIVAVGRAVKIHDLRNLSGPVLFKDPTLEHQITCVQSSSSCEGYAVGSIDGRVALEFFDQSKEPCAFRCHPKSKDKWQHLVRVNDIKFHPRLATFITGDNEGYTIIWDAQSKKRLFEFPRYPASVASLSYNCNGQQLAVASSYTYQEANELEEAPQIFVYEIDDLGRP